MFFIDSHAHIYQDEFRLNLKEVLYRAKANGVTQIVMPNVDSASIEPMLACETQFPEHCFATIGLHPCYVKENYKDELATMKHWLEQRAFVAIGEIGIDLFHDTTFKEQQEIAFIQQVCWAQDYDLPIIIHTRNAFYDTVRCLKTVKKEGFRGVFHCFGGSVQDAQVAIDMGFKLGIGGTVTYKNSGLHEVLSQIDLEHIILETDAPYLTPVPHRGKMNESSYIPLVAQKIAEIKNVSVDVVARVTTQNAKKMFKI
jgi:TatD DNase family protein